MPLVQNSPVVQSVPSLQAAPSFAGVPLMHAPLRQVVFAVQTLKSSHAAPSFPGTAVHASVPSSHEATKQPPGGAQGLGWPPPQTPAWHVSLTLQKRPSLQGRPWFAGSATQPIVGSQPPAVHWLSKTEQSIGSPLVQTPELQMPTLVHGFMSSHWAPSLPTTFLQVSIASSQAPM